jgi:RND family efflux transporter MFP subunit
MRRPSAAARPRHGVLRIGLALGGLLLGLALGCNRAPPPAAEKAPPATVKWEGPLQGALEEWTELVGTTIPLPDHVARVSAAVEGRVQWVFGDPEVKEGKFVSEGQRVDKGAVLVQLDTTIIKANLAKAEAGQDVLRQEEKQAQIAVDLAQKEVDRLQKLQERQDKEAPGTSPLVSPADRVKADYALKDAQSKLKGAQSKLVAGGKEEDALRAQLRLHTLTTPIPGRLGRVLVVPGQTLAVGTTVAEVVNLDDAIDVLCFVPPSLARRLQVGQPAVSGPIEKDPASTDSEATGKIEYIAEQAEPETGNFAIKVRLNNADAHLRANRVMRLRVLTQPGRECLSLPESAVSEDQEAPTVVIVEGIKVEKNADGKEETVGTARRLQVTLGVRDRTLHQVEIVGLEDPDKEAKVKWQGEVKDQVFVVEGGLGLQTGDKVKLDTGED